MTRRFSRALTVGIACAVLLAACSGGDGSADPPETSGATSTTERAASTTTTAVPTTEPPANDPSTVRPFLESLVDRYDVAVAAILTDPRVAENRDHPAVTEYLQLFAPGSTFPNTALQFWADEGSQGRLYRPGTRGHMYESSVQSVQVDTPDQVTFVVCSQKSIVIVDEAGNQLSAEGGTSSGSVVAVRIAGIWRLRDLTRTASSDCDTAEAQP